MSPQQPVATIIQAMAYMYVGAKNPLKPKRLVKTFLGITRYATLPQGINGSLDQNI